MLRFLTLTATALCITSAASAADKNAASPHRYDFFEKNIRPVLVKHCYSCHSQKAKKIRAKLLLDTRDGIRRGGESGPAVVPGKVEKSLLIDAIRYESFEMPPQGRLPKNVVADFVKWIKNGAPDPRDGGKNIAKKTGIDIDKGRQFWAFQPPRAVKPPAVQSTWPRTDIDRFVSHRLQQAGLTPVGDADRRSLIRRVTFDLTGLPPTRKEIHAFLNDKSPDAFSKVVDRLLVSPQFGEHWGRHWLDIARYADSNGGDINLTFRNAWRYRDYVVNAFNTDKPFDRFIVEQLAGDLLPSGSDAQRTEQMIASGFLVIGPKMLSERDKEKLRMDVVDEQLDSIGRTFLGMTIGCARCHDHKFDPIPTQDYYALAGILRSTVTVQGIRMGNVNVSGWIERELPMNPSQKKALAAYKAKLGSLNKEIAAIKSVISKKGIPTVVAADSLPGIVVDDVDAKLVGAWKKSTYTPRYVGKGYIHDEKLDKGKKSVTFTPTFPKAGRYEVRLSYTGGNGRDAKVPVTVRHAEGATTITLNQIRQPKIDKLFQAIGTFRFDAGKSGSVTIETRGTTGFVIADAVQFLSMEDIKDAKAKPKRSPKANAMLAKQQQRLKELEKQLAALKKTAPKPALMCMAPQDREQPADARVCIRGEPHNKGNAVPRGFLTVVSTNKSADISSKTSGRLQLARWIADDNNPLTSRVIVNRLWHHLFGAGIVRSVDNFGRLGERPSHPELLDHLAVQFVKDGWSIKKSIRQIVLSRTYQLSAVHSNRGMAVDPQNRLLWRHNRRRLPAEAIRDSMLAVSGRLDLQAGGSSVTGFGEQAIANNLRDKSGGATDGTKQRRSLYLPLVRNGLPEMLTVFDFADPDVVVGARSVTTVPAQALLMMNSDFVKDNARQLATNLLTDKKLTHSQRVDQLYERTLGRLPTEAEKTRALKYIRSVGASDATGGWTSFCHALLASTEFRFIE